MIRCPLLVLAALLELGICTALALSNDFRSCKGAGSKPAPRISKSTVAAKFGKFTNFPRGWNNFASVHPAQLAGSQALDSPPIVVLAFPSHEAIKPYLPLYQGRPGNLAAFFKRGPDENLIVLSLPEAGSPDAGMSVILQSIHPSVVPAQRHDLAALVAGRHGRNLFHFSNGRLCRAHRQSDSLPSANFCRHNRLMPLRELFAVTHDSPEYNEARAAGNVLCRVVAAHTFFDGG